MNRFVLFAAMFAIACEGDTGKDETGTTDTGPNTTPEVISADGLQITCAKDETTVTLTATITGTPDEALLTMSDFANSPPGLQEYNFDFDTKTGAIQPLTLTTLGNGDDTFFTCKGHFDEASAAMTYMIRLYDQGTLMACNVGSESGAEQAFIDDAGATPVQQPSNPDEFKSCDTTLALTY